MIRREYEFTCDVCGKRDKDIATGTIPGWSHPTMPELPVGWDVWYGLIVCSEHALKLVVVNRRGENEKAIDVKGFQD